MRPRNGIDAVMELVKAADAAGSQNMSSSLVRLLSKLRCTPRRDAVETREGANRELRSIVRSWSRMGLDDPNPILHRHPRGMSRERPEKPGSPPITRPSRSACSRWRSRSMRGETVIARGPAGERGGKMGLVLRHHREDAQA